MDIKTTAQPNDLATPISWRNHEGNLLVKWRPMRRKLLNLASALSLLLCAATVVLWVRSYSLFDSFFLSNGQRWWCIDSHGGSVALVICWRRSGTVQHWKVGHSPTPALVLYEDIPSHWQVLGFKRVRTVFVMERGDALPNLILNAYSAPFWSVCLLFLIAPALRTRSMLRRSVKQIGRCVRCGYDLRATSDRCPECGHIPERAKATA